MPLSVPITVCLPEVCKWGLCGPLFQPGYHSSRLRSIMAWTQGGSPALYEYTHTNIHSTPGVIAFQPQGLDFCHHSLTNHPVTHKKSARAPAWGRPTSNELLQSLHCYKHCQWAAITLLPLDFGQRGGKENRRRGEKRGGQKVRDGKRERDGRKKETFRFFHLVDYDKWPGL